MKSLPFPTDEELLSAPTLPDEPSDEFWGRY